MLKAVRGHYRGGAIELYENPALPESDVIVTFLLPDATGVVDLQALGITRDEAQDLRNRLLSFEEDWNVEGMELYDKL